MFVATSIAVNIWLKQAKIKIGKKLILKINNKNMKNNSYANTSLLGKKYSKILKESAVVILAAAFIVSGFFVSKS